MGFNSGFKGLITYLVIYLLTYLLITYLLTCLVSYLLTPCSRVHFSASQEILHILWNPKVHYCTHKCPPPVPILSQIDPVHTPTSHFLKIDLNIILPSKPGSPKWSLSLRFPHKNPVYTSPLPHTCYMPRQLILLYFITRTIFGKQYRSLTFWHRNFTFKF